MATIQMTEALSGALIVRMQAEYGQQAVSNFALDILLDSANAEIARLNEVLAQSNASNQALMERALAAEAIAEEFKRAKDPHRADVMVAADEVRLRKAERRGSNSN